MDQSNKKEYNAFMRIYKRKQYAEVKAQAIEFLGGKCVQCGSDNDLQFDHIDPKTKSFEVLKIHSVSRVRFWEEVNKCQLLCHECHNQKTLREIGKQSAIGKHGTLSTYRYCKCEECKKAHHDYWVEYCKTHNSKYVSGKRVFVKIPAPEA